MTMLHLSNNQKEKKRKRNINNDLAVLPSYDRVPFTRYSITILCGPKALNIVLDLDLNWK